MFSHNLAVFVSTKYGVGDNAGMGDNVVKYGIIYIYIYMCVCVYIYYYMSCSVSRPVPCPDVPVSARVRRTTADTGTRGMIQGVIQNKTCNNLFITYIQQKAVSYMQLGTHKGKIR